jgi:predicted nucleic acid-binding protein
MNTLREQMPRLGAGESGSLAACVANGWALASDDRDARRVASSRGVPVTGTTGILLRAVRLDLIDLDTAESVFQRRIAGGYHAPVARLAELFPP